MRRNDWPERLAAVLGEARRFDADYYCVVFVADCVQAMTDVDHLADYRGLTLDDAKAKFAGRGKTLYRHLESLFGEAVPLFRAQRGDIVVQVEPELTLGICCGQDSAFIADDGLTFQPTLAQRWCFRVQ